MKLGKFYPKKYRNDRIKKKFSFFPKILSNDEQVWLESYYTYEIWQRSGLAWAGNNWKPDYKWVEEFSGSLKRDVIEFLRKEYREEKETRKNSQDFFKYLEGIKK